MLIILKIRIKSNSHELNLNKKMAKNVIVTDSEASTVLIYTKCPETILLVFSFFSIKDHFYVL